MISCHIIIAYPRMCKQFFFANVFRNSFFVCLVEQIPFFSISFYSIIAVRC